MDTIELDIAYLRLLATADTVDMTPDTELAPRARATVDRTLGRVGLRGRELAGVGRDVLTGYPARVTADPFPDPEPLSTDRLTHRQRLTLVRDTAIDLVTVLATITDGIADTEIGVVDRTGATVRRTSWRAVMAAYIGQDLPAHAERLALSRTLQG